MCLNPRTCLFFFFLNFVTMLETVNVYNNVTTNNSLIVAVLIFHSRDAVIIKGMFLALP
jgi:hypothetical protein